MGGWSQVWRQMRGHWLDSAHGLWGQDLRQGRWLGHWKRLLDWGCWLAWARGHRGAGWWQHRGEAHGRLWKMLLEEWRAGRGWHRAH